MSTSVELGTESQLSDNGNGDAARKITNKPAETRETSPNLPDDVWLYRMIVGTLGLSVLVGIVGAITLQAVGKEVPQVLFASVAGLAGLLAPSPIGKR